MEKMKRTILLIIVAAWLLIPTGTPDDIITWYIIGLLGAQIYAIVLIILLILILHYRINFGTIKKTIKKIMK